MRRRYPPGPVTRRARFFLGEPGPLDSERHPSREQRHHGPGELGPGKNRAEACHGARAHPAIRAANAVIKRSWAPGKTARRRVTGPARIRPLAPSTTLTRGALLPL